MLARGQVDAIGVSVLVGERFYPPRLRVGEGLRVELRERHFAVNHDFAVHVDAADEVLLVHHRDFVVTVLRHFKCPLNPLARVLPAAADGVIEQIPRRHGVHNRAGLILHGVKHLRRCLDGVFCLKAHGHARRVLMTRRVARRLYIRISGRAGVVGQRNRPQEHRLAHGQKRQRVLPCFEVDAHFTRNVAVGVVQPVGTPLRLFNGRRLQVVALIILVPLADDDAVLIGVLLVGAVDPHAVEVHHRQLTVRQLAVHKERALDGAVLARVGVVEQCQVIQTRFRHIHNPLGQRLFARQDALARHALVVLKDPRLGGNACILVAHERVRIHRHGHVRVRRVLVAFQIVRIPRN